MNCFFFLFFWVATDDRCVTYVQRGGWGERSWAFSESPAELQILTESRTVICSRSESEAAAWSWTVRLPQSRFNLKLYLYSLGTSVPHLWISGGTAESHGPAKPQILTGFAVHNAIWKCIINNTAAIPMNINEYSMNTDRHEVYSGSNWFCSLREEELEIFIMLLDRNRGFHIKRN